MELYIGVKTVKAQPMSLGNYNIFKGWTIPENEDAASKGYLVGYSNADGEFNGPLMDGCHHISWSPKDVFDASYFKGLIGDVSDGYHTFDELYEFRKTYNALLFNEWAKQSIHNVHKSKRHSDGKNCFDRDDMFVVVATLPTGQISNHYNSVDWDLFKCPIHETADEFDGHTPADVLERMKALII